jgi:hypothetical protein
MCVSVCNTTYISIFALYNYIPYLKGKEIANLLKMTRHMLMGTAMIKMVELFPIYHAI